MHGRESCCCSAFSKALLRHLFGLVLLGGLRRILLLFGFFEGAPQTLFWLGFAGGSFFLMRSGGNVSRVFLVAVSQCLGTTLAAVLLFRRRSPSTCLVAVPPGLGANLAAVRLVRRRSPSTVGANLAAVRLFRRRFPSSYLVRFCLVALSFSFLSKAFRRQRFDRFFGWGFAALGHESCCCSTFSKAFPKHLLPEGLQRILLLFGFFEGAPQTLFWLGFACGSFFLMRSGGNVSRVFLVAVSQCLGTTLAAALLFRRRSPSTCLVPVPPGLGANLAAVRLVRRRSPSTVGANLAAVRLFRRRFPSSYLVRFCLVALSFSFLSKAFRRQRFESFCGCGFAWQGRESCCCSASSKALPKHLFDSVLPDGLQRILLLFGFFEGVPQALFWLGFAGWLAGFRLTGSVREVVSDVP